MENGSRELHILTTLTQEKGVWKNPVLCGILSQEQLDPDKGKIYNDDWDKICLIFIVQWNNTRIHGSLLLDTVKVTICKLYR